MTPVGSHLNLLDIVRREPIPQPWAEGEKIPWHDPAFSRRMLDEHLSQAHDAASRRFEIIDQHVEWIHQQLLQGKTTRILDLGCGPGLYTKRLARMGHDCVGIDFSPASIAYARAQAEEAGLACTYVQDDMRTADYGDGYGLVMLLYGELNVFRPEEARAILEKAHRALAIDSVLLLEPHTFDIVVEVGQQPASWYAAEKGLFSEKPHLCLQESFWDAVAKVAIQRYYMIDAATGEVARHSSSTQAYTDEAYRALLTACGFEEVMLYPSLGGGAASAAGDFLGIVARKGVV